MATVSVLLPVFDAEPWVAQAVESVLAQTCTDFELLVIDDGSTDGSGRVLEELAAQHPALRLVRRANRGYLATLNELVGLARGRYLARIDGDDFVAPGWLAETVAFLEAHPAVVACGVCAEAVDRWGDPITALDVPASHAEIEAVHLRGDSAIHHPGVVMRAASVRAVGAYRPGTEPCDDYDLWLRLGEVGELRNLSARLVWKRLRIGSALSSRLAHRDRAAAAALARAWERRGLPGRPPEVRSRTTSDVDVYRMWGWQALLRGNLAVARRYARSALLRAPWSPASWRLAACVLRGW